MSNKDIKVPNIGEFKDVEVIEVLIKKGQKIKKNDPLITIESDKSSVEIPSSDDGTVTSVKVKIGDKVSEGDKIIEIESEKEIKKTSVQELTKNQLSKEIKKDELKKSNETKNIIIKDFSAKASASPKVRKFARQLGININTIPVMDLLQKSTHEIIKDRSFSDEVNTVKSLGKLCISFLKKKKIASVAKHVPGHGCSNQDSHLNLPVVLKESNKYIDNSTTYKLIESILNLEKKD